MDQVVTQLSDNLKSDDERYFEAIPTTSATTSTSLPENMIDETEISSNHYKESSEVSTTNNDDRPKRKRNSTDLNDDEEKYINDDSTHHNNGSVSIVAVPASGSGTEYEKIKKFSTAKRKLAVTVKMLPPKLYTKENPKPLFGARSKTKRILGLSAKCKIHTILGKSIVKAYTIYIL